MVGGGVRSLGSDRIPTRNLITDADQADIDALHAKVTATSPVGHTLSRAIPVDITLA